MQSSACFYEVVFVALDIDKLVELGRVRYGEYLRARERSGEEINGYETMQDPTRCFLEQLAQYIRDLRGLSMIETGTGK